MRHLEEKETFSYEKVISLRTHDCTASIWGNNPLWDSLSVCIFMGVQPTWLAVTRGLAAGVPGMLESGGAPTCGFGFPWCYQVVSHLLAFQASFMTVCWSCSSSDQTGHLRLPLARHPFGELFWAPSVQWNCQKHTPVEMTSGSRRGRNQSHCPSEQPEDVWGGPRPSISQKTRCPGGEDVRAAIRSPRGCCWSRWEPGGQRPSPARMGTAPPKRAVAAGAARGQSWVQPAGTDGCRCRHRSNTGLKW